MTWTIGERIVGCLRGIAVGDAIGKQTETLSHGDVSRWYPDGIRGFEGAPNTVIPRYLGNSKREWRIGETTDDTERTIAVARAIIADRTVSHSSVGREMLRCTKCVHPGLKSLWEFHQAHDPSRMASVHDGCGAAIRVGPVGILYASDCLDALVGGAYEASISTHGGSLAIAGAAANAAAVSAAIDGASGPEILELAVTAASRAEARWPGGRPEPALARAILTVQRALASLPVLRPSEVARRCFPSQPLTIVPLALALSTIMQSADDSILVAANVGGDSDSVASIAGGILGARYPGTVNSSWYEVVESVNGHDLLGLASELIPLRRRCSQPDAVA
jgi:ADP-ribosylglycohydrolase